MIVFSPSFPWLQFIREYTGKVDELVKDKIEAQIEVKSKEKEEKDVIAQQVITFIISIAQQELVFFAFTWASWFSYQRSIDLSSCFSYRYELFSNGLGWFLVRWDLSLSVKLLCTVRMAQFI